MVTDRAWAQVSTKVYVMESCCLHDAVTMGTNTFLSLRYSHSLLTLVDILHRHTAH